MSSRSIRRIAVFTPLPPTRSGIAVYNAGFLPLLAEHVDVTAFVDDALYDVTEAPPGVGVRPASSHDPARFDLTVFHMGNHLGYHEYVYDALRRTPGLVVLHDLAMADFFAMLPSRRPDLVDVHFPRSSVPLPKGAIDIAGLAPIVRRSRGVLVHSVTRASSIRRCFPGVPIIASHLALPVPPPDVASVSREILDWPEHCLVVGAFGSIVEHKRFDRVLDIVAGVRLVGHDVRVVLGGWVGSSTAMDELDRKIADLGLTDVVRIFTDVTERELHALHRMCDTTLDLRDAVTGAASMSVATSLANDRVTITTSSPEFTDIEHPLLRHVPADPMSMVESCSRILVDMADARRKGSISMPLSPASLEVRRREQSAAVVTDHLDAIETCLTGDDPVDRLLTRAGAGEAVRGVPPTTVVADVTATTGLMEYGRALIDVLLGASAPLQLHVRQQVGASRDERRDTMRIAGRIPSGRAADVEIWFANLNEFVEIPDDELRPPGTERHVIASWFWELPLVVEPFQSHLRRVDEIWVGSPFVARTLRQYCDAAITIVPMPIQAVPDQRLDRRDFGLPDDDVLFYFDFDANSHPARKNPMGLIEAFRTAFTVSDRDRQGRRPRLVLKGLHMDRNLHRRTTESLRTAMDEVGGVIIAEELDRRELDALVNCCDVYVSLHRAEGLGIGMLEAMYLGKPVIAPSYPDRWLFPASEIGFGVPARIRAIDSTDTAQFPESTAVYAEGLPWAEPDVDVAARQMRRLFDQPDLRGRLGARGARLVRQHYNAPAALEVMSSRLRAATLRNPRTRTNPAQSA